MYPSVKAVSANADYTLSIAFSNGENGVLDMKPFLDFGIFARLKNPNAFAAVAVSFDTVEWKSGADLDPKFVYQKCRILANSELVILRSDLQ